MYYLGVDGGGTKTAFMLIDEQGKVRGFVRKPGSNYLQLTTDELRKILADGILTLCKQADIEIKDICYSFLGLPVYGEIEEVTLFLEATVTEILGNDQFTCSNDVEVGWAGSLACQPGINLVGGTGAIGFGRDEQGNCARASGWDFFLGDEGSAYWLGKKALALFTKEADGREKKTYLYDLFREKFKLKNDLDLISVIHDSLQIKREKIAQLALVLYEAALNGDEKAIQIYEEAAFEYSLTVNAILDKLDFPKKEHILISYSGGVFQAGSLILEPLKKYLKDNHVKLIQPILEPVTGAALYALIIDQNIADHSRVIEQLKDEEKTSFLINL